MGVRSKVEKKRGVEKLSEEQERVKRGLVDVVLGRSEEVSGRVVCVQGGAGTGKTTLIKYLVIDLMKLGYKKEEILLVTPTGKASVRLMEVMSEVDSEYVVRTIHACLFRKDESVGMGERLKYIPKKKEEFSIEPRVIVMDEVSMVGKNLLSKVERSIEVPIVMFGDINQLKPIDDVYNRYILSPNYVLNKVFRQGKDSDILKIAYDVSRCGYEIGEDGVGGIDLESPMYRGDGGRYKDIVVFMKRLRDRFLSGRYGRGNIYWVEESDKFSGGKVDRGRGNPYRGEVDYKTLVEYEYGGRVYTLRDFLDKGCMMICGMNLVRNYLNRVCREIKGYCPIDVGSEGFRRKYEELGYDPRYPQEGDKINCNKNMVLRDSKGVVCGYLYNGASLIVDKVRGVYGDNDLIVMDLWLIGSDGSKVLLKGVKSRLTCFFGVEVSGVKEDMNVCKFDYGYFITGHKSQGSESELVLVYTDWSDESSIRNWYYTVFTRSKKSLIIVKCRTFFKDFSEGKPKERGEFKASIPNELLPSVEIIRNLKIKLGTKETDEYDFSKEEWGELFLDSDNNCVDMDSYFI
jgi:hypothetical protein